MPKSKSEKTPKVRSMTGRKRGRPRKTPIENLPTNPSENVVAADFTGMNRPPAPEVGVIDRVFGILLPSPEDSVKVLAELAQLNDQAQAARKVYLDLKDKTKVAKEKYDSLAEMVLTRLRVCTHKSDLPLFSEQQEADLSRMVEAGAQNGGENGIGASGRDDLGAVDPTQPPAPSDAPSDGLEDSGVF